MNIFNIFRNKEKKPRSLKFYLCLMAVLAGVYLALVGILAIRNPKTEPAEVSSSVSVIESSSSSEVRTEPEKSAEKKPSSDNAGTEQKEEPIKEKRNTALDDYGRGKERYTKMGAQDVFSRVNVSITNAEELEKIVGSSMDTVKGYLNIYASHNDINAASCTVLDHVYVGFLSERVEIYMQYDDENRSLVTVLYEPANTSHASHVDVLPCQYSLKEIQKQVWK